MIEGTSSLFSQLRRIFSGVHLHLMIHRGAWTNFMFQEILPFFHSSCSTAASGSACSDKAMALSKFYGIPRICWWSFVGAAFDLHLICGRLFRAPRRNGSCSLLDNCPSRHWTTSRVLIFVTSCCQLLAWSRSVHMQDNTTTGCANKVFYMLMPMDDQRYCSESA